MPGEKFIFNKYLLVVAVELFFCVCCVPVTSSEPYDVPWVSVNIGAEHQYIGFIGILFSKSGDGRFSMVVDSKLYSGSLLDEYKEGIYNPVVNSVALQMEGSDLTKFRNRFAICFFYGNPERINIGTIESPKYRWKRNQVTYIFEADNIKKEVIKSSSEITINNCTPY